MIINASPLIIFGKLNKISILKELYKKIEISNEVYQETVLKGIGKNSPDAFILKWHIDNKDIEALKLDAKNLALANKIQNIYDIDIGEAETIALACQLNKKELIIDEKAAREAAKSFGIKPLGSLRVLLAAYQNDLIKKDEVYRLIIEMENSKYRLSPNVLIEFWELFGKLKKNNKKFKYINIF